MGAITHHRGWAAAVAARAAEYRGLGVDLEVLRHPSPALLRRILRPGEREALEGLPERERALRFTLVFSAKESLYKALNPHTGVFLGFQDAEILAPEKIPLPESDTDAAGSGRLQWRLSVTGGEGFPPGYTGEGCYHVEGDGLLTGVWVGRG
ncbi:MAG: 4-phosphopantetheinyl transferase family protein [Candidatus Glassbacteria bacterium]|nr:4-phosphopantetheinyl transferase family protein [Candidatus Glassbacteria bacterium]